MGVMFSDRRVLAALVNKKRDKVKDMKETLDANVKYGTQDLKPECSAWIEGLLNPARRLANMPGDRPLNFWQRVWNYVFSSTDTVFFAPILPFLTAWDAKRGADMMFEFLPGAGAPFDIKVSVAFVSKADSVLLAGQHLKRLVCLAMGVDRIFSYAGSSENDSNRNQRHHKLRPIAEQLHWQLSHEMESFRYSWRTVTRGRIVCDNRQAVAMY